MPSLSNLDDRPPRRHDLMFVRPAAWRALLLGRDDLNGEPLVARWADKGWPLVRRRPLPGETHGVPLGLPLPPSAGKRRLSFLVPRTDIIAVISPLALRAVLARRLAPGSRRSTGSTRGHRGTPWRCVCSAASPGARSRSWTISTARSDLDLLIHVHRDADLAGLTDDLASIEATAPMSLDGEIVRDDGVAVNWREIDAGAAEVLAKSADGVTVLDVKWFLAGQAPPS